jgi:hypothetical protein
LPRRVARAWTAAPEPSADRSARSRANLSASTGVRDRQRTEEAERGIVPAAADAAVSSQSLCSSGRAARALTGLASHRSICRAASSRGSGQVAPERNHAAELRIQPCSEHRTLAA